jgi:hypothetical protein
MFVVRWERSTVSQLADAWVNGDSDLREAITAAVHEADRLLQSHPESKGESRAHGRRIMFVPPVAVTFRVDTQSQTVSVLHVRVFQRRQ